MPRTYAAHDASAERRLMAAVLENALQALHDGRRTTRSEKEVLREIAWFTSSETRDLFAFQCICEVLGIDARRIREHVLATVPTSSSLPRSPAATGRRCPAAP